MLSRRLNKYYTSVVMQICLDTKCYIHMYFKNDKKQFMKKRRRKPFNISS